MFRIHHQAADCIGCDSCVEIAPAYFTMDEEGLAALISPSKVTKAEVIATVFDDDDRALVDEAIEACPVGIISRR